ncbi:MAG: glycosyltransferase family 2 protein [Candidatus Bathyarchaeum sp.]|nr:MAG: glycosyltransferase family 2 protein [Candidatus Bathyarchaeum sp.]
MFGTKILCVIVSTGDYEKTLQSIKDQTVQPEKIVIADKPYPQFRFVGERVGMAMRDALSREKLDNYTHILRVDGDTILQKDHVQHSLSKNVDLVGGGGYAQLLKVSAFKDLFNCDYPVDFAEDSCLSWAVIYSNKHTFHKGKKPILPSPKKYPIQSWLEYGAARNRFGYSLFRTLAAFRNYRSTTFVGFKIIWVILGYLLAKAQRQKQHSFVKLKKTRIHARKRDYI